MLRRAFKKIRMVLNHLSTTCKSHFSLLPYVIVWTLVLLGVKKKLFINKVVLNSAKIFVFLVSGKKSSDLEK